MVVGRGMGRKWYRQQLDLLMASPQMLRLTEYASFFGRFLGEIYIATGKDG